MAQGGSYDVIVAGLGAMGSASMYALTRPGGRNRRVLGIDHPLYVPIVRRAFDLWRDLERSAGRRLYTKTRGITLGPENGTLVRGARASAEAFRVPHRVLSAAGVHRHFPDLQPLDDMVGVVEDRAGVLFPEQCIAALLEGAEKAGAQLRRDEVVTGWDASDAAVVVRTTAGEYRANQLVISGGAWMSQLVPELASTLKVARQPIHWFEPASHPEEFAAANCPVTLWEYAPDRVFYTLPDFGDGVKAAVHHEGHAVDPDHVDRTTSMEEDAQVTDLMRRFMPHAKGHLRESQVCLYTNTPDLHFLIDMHPTHPKRVVVVSACSGHGFKFAPAVGEIVADLVAGAKPRFDLSMFRMTRFQS